MSFFKYNFSILVIYITAVNAAENMNSTNHLCEETVTRLSDDGGRFHETVLVCCPGYNLDTNEQCMPICQRPCIYGFCKAPNVCECKEGYKMKRNECVPICKQNCINGYCSKPDFCVCKYGFELDADNKATCLPICEPKCGRFSKCLKSLPPSPNSCHCIEGYIENEKTKTCEPYCRKGCHNGVCIAPETCSCSSGYEFHHANETTCIPKCEPKCQKYSSCIAPNVCACEDGYKLNRINKLCEPICREQIENSICIKPPNTWICTENYQHDRRIDKCVLEYCTCNSNGYCLKHKDDCMCYEGFTKNITSGQCETQCYPLCENSICIANNVCECLDKYHKTSMGHICERNDFCNGSPCRNGECLLTGECRCKIGFIKSLSYRGQIQCDKVQTFVGKLLTLILGIPVLLTCSAFFFIYAIAKKKSNGEEEQEMILINRN